MASKQLKPIFQYMTEFNRRTEAINTKQIEIDNQSWIVEAEDVEDDDEKVHSDQEEHPQLWKFKFQTVQ